MSTTKKITKITDKQVADNGVQALSNKPNSPTQYGVGGLNSTSLKLWFDKLAILIKNKINEISDILSGDESTKYIRVLLDSLGIENLEDLITSFSSGEFADKVLKLYPNAGSNTKQTLQNVINNLSMGMSNLTEDKLSKITATSEYKRAYIIMPDGTQSSVFIAESPTSNSIPLYTSNGQVNVAFPVSSLHASNKGYTDTQDKLLGASVELSLNTSNYIMTLNLKNTDGTILSTANVDFPIESVVVGGEYSGGVLTLRLKGGETLNIDISAIIDGLVNTSTFNNGIATLNGRIDTTNSNIQALVEKIEVEKVYAHSAYTAEEAETARHYTKGGKIDKRFKEIDTNNGCSISLSLDTNNYQLTISMKNRKGDVISSGMVDLPIESLITNASYSNKVITLTLQNGNTLPINIADVISGLIPETRKINGKVLSSDVTLSANDIGAYPTSQTYNKNEVDSAINIAKQVLQNQIDASSGGSSEELGGTYLAMEAEKASGYIKGGQIDQELKKIKNRLLSLENNNI